MQKKVKNAFSNSFKKSKNEKLRRTLRFGHFMLHKLPTPQGFLVYKKGRKYYLKKSCKKGRKKAYGVYAN